MIQEKPACHSPSFCSGFDQALLSGVEEKLALDKALIGA
jgi:hypothetical protein